MNRRQFITKGVAALTAGVIASQELLAAETAKRNRGRIGIQLYSIREQIPHDVPGCLKKLSDMGFSSVELYGFRSDKFLGYTLKDFRSLLKDMGMTISGTHTGSAILSENTNDKEWDFWKNCVSHLKSGGAKWAVHAGMPRIQSIDDLKRVSAHFNRVGEVCRKGGIKFAYHNHRAEFGTVDGEVILDYFIKNTDPKLVSFQLDTGHAVRAGADCVSYLRKYPKRFAMWHASDYNTAIQEYVDVGTGNVPYPALFDLVKVSGLQDLTLEQETGGDIFGSIRNGFNYLKQFKWTKV